MPVSGNPFCKVLKDGITDLEKSIVLDNKGIGAQQEFIRKLIETQAKPELVNQAKSRLADLQAQLESDEAQLNAFREEFQADCT